MGSNKQEKKGWFTLPGRPGDRTLEQQLKGLSRLFDSCKNKTILDAGCAEGLIAIELAKRGARHVYGLEIKKQHVEEGLKLVGNLPVSFEVVDLNSWQTEAKYDLVIGLAILHKVRDPGALARSLARAANDMLVLKLPLAHAPNVVDKRSGSVCYPIQEILLQEGMVLKYVDTGEYDEWVGYWYREAGLD